MDMPPPFMRYPSEKNGPSKPFRSALLLLMLMLVLVLVLVLVPVPVPVPAPAPVLPVPVLPVPEWAYPEGGNRECGGHVDGIYGAKCSLLVATLLQGTPHTHAHGGADAGPFHCCRRAGAGGRATWKEGPCAANLRDTIRRHHCRKRRPRRSGGRTRTPGCGGQSGLRPGRRGGGGLAGGAPRTVRWRCCCVTAHAIGGR